MDAIPKNYTEKNISLIRLKFQVLRLECIAVFCNCIENYLLIVQFIVAGFQQQLPDNLSLLYHISISLARLTVIWANCQHQKHFCCNNIIFFFSERLYFLSRACVLSTKKLDYYVQLCDSRNKYNYNSRIEYRYLGSIEEF